MGTKHWTPEWAKTLEREDFDNGAIRDELLEVVREAQMWRDSGQAQAATIRELREALEGTMEHLCRLLERERDSEEWTMPQFVSEARALLAKTAPEVSP